MISFIYKAIRFFIAKVLNIYSQLVTMSLMKINNVTLGKNFISRGIPKLYIQGSMKVGTNFKINNTITNNPIGRNYKCMFVVRYGARLVIGNNVGMSGTTIVAQKSIIIGDNVKIGGNVCIYDTDFHSLDAQTRADRKEDFLNTNKKDIFISDNVFIGAHSTILKGIHIGKNAIIGACSVVTKDIPENQIWAGNPARYIREIEV